MSGNYSFLARVSVVISRLTDSQSLGTLNCSCLCELCSKVKKYSTPFRETFPTTRYFKQAINIKLTVWPLARGESDFVTSLDIVSSSNHCWSTMWKFLEIWAVREDGFITSLHSLVSKSLLLPSTLFFIYRSEGKLSRPKEPHFD
jgi:hypothetical protein